MAEVKENLDQKPREATRIIKDLDSKTKEELEEYGIEDRTEVVLEVRRIHTKRN